MRRIFVVFVVTLFGLGLWGLAHADGRSTPNQKGKSQTSVKTTKAPKAAPEAKTAPVEISMWDRWDRVLTDITYRYDGRMQVDYGKAKNNPDLAHLVAQISTAKVRTMTSEQQKAFWINAYNISIVNILIQGDPVNSVKDVMPFFGIFSRKRFTVAGRRVTLDEIEKTILLPRFKDARIHMALNCASGGCPDLYPSAYRADKLSSQLDIQSRGFLTMRVCNRVEDGKTLLLSELFKWYLDDFGGAGGIRLWIKKYGTREQRNVLKKKNLSIDYIDYDWSLNGTFNRKQ